MIIRPPKSNEYEQVIRCLKEARGANYYSTKFYDIDYLRGGEHELFAAFDDKGEMTGVTGLSLTPFEKDKITLSLLNIRPQYTGQGIGTELLTYTTNLLKSRSAKSVKGHVVTRYTSIQKVLEKLDLKPTGILKGIRDGRNITPPIQGKCALAIYVRGFISKLPKTLYVHNDIIDLAKHVYSNLDVDVLLTSDGKCDSISEVDSYYDSHDNVLSVHIKSCVCESGLCLDDFAVNYRSSENLTELVFLNLYSPSAICGYTSLINNGYFFCGFDPLGEFENAVFYKGNTYSAIPEATNNLTMLLNKINEVGNCDCS